MIGHCLTRDLGGHLDTFRGWSAAPAARVGLVVSRLMLHAVLPLDFHGRLLVVRSMFIPGALHGTEASLLAQSSLPKLRSSNFDCSLVSPTTFIQCWCCLELA